MTAARVPARSEPTSRVRQGEFQSVGVYELTESAGEHYGQIRAELQGIGKIIENYDLWLAAHARAEGWIIVTNNDREFVRVPGLQVENWVTPKKSSPQEFCGFPMPE